MKINIRQEAAQPATDTDPGHKDRSCIWIAGDDGETVNTTYLDPGQQVTIETEGATSTGEVEPFGADPTQPVPPPEQPPAAA